MPSTELATTIVSWFLFGAVAFLGAYTAYFVIRSKPVQAISAFVLAFLGGFALMMLIAFSIAG
jgi:uncharacterized membrane-anchored protein